MSIHKISTDKLKSMPNHEPPEDWNDEDDSDGEVFFVSSFDDEGGEEEVFGNDYFERNGIPVPEDESDEDEDTRDAIDDALHAGDESDDLDRREYHSRFEDEDIILDDSIDEANQDDSIGQEGEGEEGDSTPDEDTKEDGDDDERKRKDTKEDGNDDERKRKDTKEDGDDDERKRKDTKEDGDDERKKSKSPVKPWINPFIGSNQKQKREWKYIKQIPFTGQCQLCSRTFSSKYLYMLHDPCYSRRLALKRRGDKSTKIEDISTEMDGKSVEINSGLNQDFPFECLECDKKFETRTFIGNHARSHYTPDFKCELCPFVTYWHSTASRHEKSHLRKKGECNLKGCDTNEVDLKYVQICNRDLKCVQVCNRDLKYVQICNHDLKCVQVCNHDLKCVQILPVEKVCNLCFKTFQTKLTYINHPSSSEKRLEGKWDQNKLKNKSGMEDKSTKINQGLIGWKHECIKRHKGYNYSNGLKCHSSSHLNPQFECRICPFINCHPVSGLRHGKIHLKNDKEDGEWDDEEDEECGERNDEECDDEEDEEECENDEDGEQQEEEKNVNPDLIQKRPGSNEELKFTESIPFHKTCDHCGKGFQSKGRYITHSPCYIQKLAAKKIRINSEKNNSTENNSTENNSKDKCSRIEYLDENFLYECTVCDKRFSRRQYLSQHAQTHFGPSFKCKLCPHTSQFKQHATLHDWKHQSEYQVTDGMDRNGKEAVVEKSPFKVSRKRKGGGIEETSSKRIKSDSRDDKVSNDAFFSADEYRMMHFYPLMSIE